MRVFRIILPASPIGAAADFYQSLLGQTGRRVSAGRHYFDLGQMVLACYDPVAEGDPGPATPVPEPLYLAVHDLPAFHARAVAAGARFAQDGAIAIRPWGERSFYCRDPFGNPLCFVEAGTEFTGM